MAVPLARPVVVGLDKSDAARAAVEWACDLAAHRHLPVRLVHAYGPVVYPIRSVESWSPPDLNVMLANNARRLLEETREIIRLAYPELEVDDVVVPGEPAELLNRETQDAEIVVLGLRGSGGFTGLVVGSTALHVATHASCPVMAVPEGAPDDPDRRGIVLGVDGSRASEPAIAFAYETASVTAQPLVAVHAWYDPTRTGVGRMMSRGYDLGEVAREERLALAESMAGWQEKYPDVDTAQLVVLGHPVATLAAHARRARMLVVGSRGRGRLASALLGSVGHGALHHATSPVVVVPPAR